MKDNPRAFSLVEILIVCVLLLLLALVATPSARKSQTLASVAQTNKDLNVLGAALVDYKNAATTNGMFPPAGGVAQDGWSPWTGFQSFWPNSGGPYHYSCSILWLPGSFYGDTGDWVPGSAEPLPAFGNEHYDLRVMTSPIEVLMEIPLDPFKRTSEPFPNVNQYDYFGLDPTSSFVLRGLGPDHIAALGCDDGAFDCDCFRAACLRFGHADEDLGRRPFFGNVDVRFGCQGCDSLEQALRVGTAVYAPTNGTDSSGDLFFTHLDVPNADFNGDGTIDFKDIAILQSQWQDLDR